MDERPTVGSTFSGVGGLDLGLERAGWRTAWQCEADEWRRDVLRARFGVPVYPDVREVAAGGRGRPEPGIVGRELDGADGGRGGARPEDGDPCRVDLLCGGFPCQDLSVAGRRAGLDGARSGLFFEFARIADDVLPAGGWVLIENVPGLLSSDRGRDFAVLLATLAELGFHDLAWRVLDSRHFGVPQRRRRVFILARRARGDRACAVLLEPEGGGGDPAARSEARAGAAGGAQNGAGSLGWADVSPTLGNPAGGTRTTEVNQPLVVNAPTRNGVGAGGGPDDNAAQANHLVPVGFYMIQDPIHSEGGTPALGRTSNGMGVGDAAGVRRLTPVECERLQGWPDGWTAPPGLNAPDSRRYAAIGDGVTAPVAEWIGRRMLAVHEGREP